MGFWLMIVVLFCIAATVLCALALSGAREIVDAGRESAAGDVDA